MDDYIWLVSSTLSEMRLMIEGALLLYEDIVSPLFQTARAKDKAEDAATLETLESALHGLKDRVCKLQTEYQKTAINPR